MTCDELVREIEELDPDEISKIFWRVKQADLSARNTKIRTETEANRKYIGKCYRTRTKPMDGMFPEMNKYLKVVSERASNEFRMTALVFCEHPLYWFNVRTSNYGTAGEGYQGNFEFFGIDTEDYPFFCRHKDGGIEIEHLTEISREEYEQAMDRYIEELKHMEWYADHRKFGGKLPSDKDWREK